MRKLDLETLTEDRLRGAISPQTYHQALDLVESGAVHIDVEGELAADFTVGDVRMYSVEIRITNEAITLRCNCTHASRGLICEHSAAAWLALIRSLERKRPAMWQQQIQRMVDAAGDTPARGVSQYFLFFSLQAETYGYSDNYRIVPYTLALAGLPADLRKLDPPPDVETVIARLADASGLAARGLKMPHYALDAAGCCNQGREAVDLANLLIERNRTRNFGHYLMFPLDYYLSLFSLAGIDLYCFEAGNPLAERLTVHTRPVSIRLNLARHEGGLRLSVEPVSRDDPHGEDTVLSLHDVDIVHQSPLWVLSDGHLFTLQDPAALDLPHLFGDRNELLIPAEHVDDFAERFLIELARRFSLSGDALHWREVDAEPQLRLYLSDENGELQAQLRFGYGELEALYNAERPEHSIRREQSEPGDLRLARILRRPQVEKDAFELLASAAFGLKRAPQPARPGIFRLRARTHPVDFLLNHVPRLASAGFEIYGEEQLKSARVNRSTPTISFKVSSGIDWFDVQTAVNFGEQKVNLADLRRLMRKRERYIKLADGTIGEIPAEWIERYAGLFAMGEAEGENLRLSSHHLALIELAANADAFAADQEFERRRRRLRALAEKRFGDANGSGAGGDWIEEQPLPAGFHGELRRYQRSGFDWMHFLREIRFGGCLADDMGLGKTIQTLAFLQSLYESPAERPAASLLVAPRSLLVNWQREASRFTPGLRFLEFFNSSRSKESAAFDNYDVVITTYGVLLRDIRMLHGYTFHYAILDESQAIKNPESQTARAAHLLRAGHKLALTGTPIENSTAELWSQFAFLNPGLLGGLQYFKTEFGLPIEKRNDPKAAESLRRLVFPFILRRTKDQVAPELPPRTEEILYCDMEPAQRKLYNKTRDYYRGVVLGILDSEGINAGRMKILEGLLRLRQICNHPQLVNAELHGASAKFDLLLETLETLQAENHKALVFSQFVKMLALVRKQLDLRGTPYTYLDGHTVARQEQVDRFQADAGIPFFLISLRAGGLGLNLTAADYVIHIDPWWNPAVEMQASDRTHRIGQDKPVFIYKLIARDSVEEKILILQERKRALVDQIITTEKAFFKNLTREDVEELFR